MKRSAATRISEPTTKSNPSLAANEISFYRASEKPYGMFSNLYRRPIEFEGEVFATAEHAYQAGKARKKEVRQWILSAPTPGLVAMAAHGLYTWDIVSDWSRIKYDRMRRVLRAKFTQHNDLRELLLSTGDARIVEVGKVANPVNCTWGEVNGKGKNMLGVLLMELRTELQNAPAAPNIAKRRSATTKARKARSATPLGQGATATSK